MNTINKYTLLILLWGLCSLFSAILTIIVSKIFVLTLLLGIVFVIINSHSIQKHQILLWKESVKLKRSSIKPESIECPVCNKWNLLTNKYCNSCGTLLRTKCFKCNFENIISDKCCTNCGSQM
jgi:hypothetical protein